MKRRTPGLTRTATLFPYTTLFRSPGPVVYPHEQGAGEEQRDELDSKNDRDPSELLEPPAFVGEVVGQVPHRPEKCHAGLVPNHSPPLDRKSTRLNSSH